MVCSPGLRRGTRRRQIQDMEPSHRETDAAGRPPAEGRYRRAGEGLEFERVAFFSDAV